MHTPTIRLWVILTALVWNTGSLASAGCEMGTCAQQKFQEDDYYAQEKQSYCTLSCEQINNKHKIDPRLLKDYKAHKKNAAKKNGALLPYELPEDYWKQVPVAGRFEHELAAQNDFTVQWDNDSTVKVGTTHIRVNTQNGIQKVYSPESVFTKIGDYALRNIGSRKYIAWVRTDKSKKHYLCVGSPLYNQQELMTVLEQDTQGCCTIL